jgi:hypothetical protein
MNGQPLLVRPVQYVHQWHDKAVTTFYSDFASVSHTQLKNSWPFLLKNKTNWHVLCRAAYRYIIHMSQIFKKIITNAILLIGLFRPTVCIFFIFIVVAELIIQLHILKVTHLNHIFNWMTELYKYVVEPRLIHRRSGLNTPFWTSFVLCPWYLLLR